MSGTEVTTKSGVSLCVRLIELAELFGVLVIWLKEHIENDRPNTL